MNKYRDELAKALQAMSPESRATFLKLQSKYHEAYEKARAFRIDLDVKYGNYMFAKSADSKRFDALQARSSKSQDALWSWLCEVGLETIAGRVGCGDLCDYDFLSR